jgi:Flp pilus assembly pilin Flp
VFVLGVTIVPGIAALERAQVNDFILRTHMHCRQERGQTMAEYVVVLGIITVAIMLALGLISGSVSGALSSVSSKI